VRKPDYDSGVQVNSLHTARRGSTSNSVTQPMQASPRRFMACSLWLLLLAPIGLAGQELPPQEPPATAVEATDDPSAPSAPTAATNPTAAAEPAEADTEAAGAAGDSGEAANDEDQNEAAAGGDTPPDADTAPADETPEPAARERIETATGLEALPGVGGEWTRRVDELSTAIRERSAEPADANALYPDLVAALREASDRLAEAVKDDPASAAEKYKQTALLYVARQSLLQEVTPELQTRLHRFDGRGLSEFLDEVLHIRRGTQYQFATFKDRGGNWLSEIWTSPVSVLQGVVTLILLVGLFRWWRGHGAKGLQSWRQKLMGLRPRKRRNIRLAKFIWYVDRVRPPLEWLAFTGTFLAVFVPDEAYYLKLVWAVSKWVLVGWFAVLLIDAAATRGAAGIAKDSSGLRLRSLRLVATWVVVSGLVLELVTLYAGQGTIYAWFRTLTTLLLVPILVILVQWWRSEIFERLKNRREKPALIERRLAKTTGFGGFLSATLCAVYLMAQGILRWALRLLSRFEFGKRALAYFFRREVARQSEQQRLLAAGQPIPQEVATQLIEGDVPLVAKVAKEELQTLLTLARSVKGNVAAVIGSRGAGKTTLLKQVRETLGETALLVDCPAGSYDSLLIEIGRALGLPPEQALAEDSVRAALRAAEVEVIVVDNAHRLTKPTLGGLDEIDRLLEFEARLGPAVSWIISLDSVAWQFINRLRSSLLLAHQIVHLQPWTEEQIGDLVEARNKVAEVDPDFEQLVLPAHLDETGFEGEERTQTGFYRILWDSAGGNPEVAIRLWVRSLVVIDGGGTAVRLFPPPSTDRLDGLDPLMLFGLRTILQLETGTAEEIAECLQISDKQVHEILRSALSLDLIEKVVDRYHVPWSAHQAVKLILTRQNLLKA